MTVRHTAMWVMIVTMLLVHLVAGVAGKNTQLCVCAGGVTIEKQDTVCCYAEVEDQAPPDTTGGCTDCHLIPLPDASAVTLSPAPSLPPAAVLPVPVQIDEIIWPAQPERWTARLRGHPPDPLPRLIRTVILTC